MGMKDWKCATEGCGHLEYQHNGFLGAGSCATRKNRRRKTKSQTAHAGDSCPCTGYKAPAVKAALMLK